MKFRTGFALGLLTLAALFGLAVHFRDAILIALAKTQLPHIAPNHPVSWALGPDTAPAGKRLPNIIVILADDMGYNDITFNGGGIAGGQVPTPNIDSIGHEGVSFDRGYDGNATCAPSRATIMTGRYATRFGFEFTPAPVLMERLASAEHQPDDFALPHFFAERVKDMPPGTAKGAAAVNMLAVPPSEIMIAKVLQARGYHTLHFGKWHLGSAPGTRPEQRGFDESLGFMGGGSKYLPEDDRDVENAKQAWDPIDRFIWPIAPYMIQYNGSPMFAPKGYMTDYLAEEAVKSIHANRNRPFFIYFAPNAIHTPLQAKKEDYDALPGIKDHRLRVYGAMARNLDANVGRILAALKAENLDRDTLVIFTSDNGGADYIGLPEINKPFRGWKMTFFEGGIHSPFFMRWPGMINANTHYSSPVGHIDIFPTAAAAAGAKIPRDRTIDGVDLLPFLQGKATGRPHQTLFWRSGAYKVVLDGDWKLQSSEAQHKVWLFNLATDPTEQHELSTVEPARVRTMLALLKTQDDQSAKSIWPSLVRAPIFVDHPGGQSQKKGQDFIFWDN